MRLTIKYELQILGSIMNICITGALGHIGSKLIRNLTIPGLKKVYLVDNLSTQRYASLFDLPAKNSYLFKELDIFSPDIENIIKDSQAVIHLAAITDAESSFYEKDLVEKVNKQGVERIAELCIKYDTSLIFPSTTSVYGSQKNVVDETCTDEELKPQSPYAESKRYAEKLLQKLHKDKNLKVVVFRVGTIFGYSIGMRFHTAVNKFIYQAVNGIPISVWKTALHQKRPYCELNDCINALSHIVKKNYFDGEIYNLVTHNYTVNDILETIKTYIPDMKINFVNSPIMNQLSYDVDNSKSLKIGIKYTGKLDMSIKETITKLRHINYSVKKNL